MYDGIQNQSYGESKMHAQEYLSRRKRKRKQERTNEKKWQKERMKKEEMAD